MFLAVAVCAVQFWLFRLGVLWGLLGLMVTKHVVIAWLCQVVGLDRRAGEPVREGERPGAGGRGGIPMGARTWTE